MSSEDRIGIWMDHSNAHVIELNKEPYATRVISSNFSHDDKEEALSRSEQLMHNKRQQQRSAYYSELSDVIANYREVVIFGPTDAKTELFNTLQNDLRSANIKIEVQAADKMTENQKIAFVKNHYS